MFTGLVQQTQRLQAGVDNGRLEIACFANDIKRGESISINGVCLTVVDFDANKIGFDVSPETLSVTNLASLKSGDCINIERAMLASDRFGGHFVQGHVDAKVRLASIDQNHDHWVVTFDQVQSEHLGYLVEKGSVTIDGVSLTVNHIDSSGFSVTIIPETQTKTNLGSYKPDSWLNIEYDMIVKTLKRTLALTLKESS